MANTGEKPTRLEDVALVEMALQALGRCGIQKAALVAFADNVEGNAFWEKIGFTCRTDLNYRNKYV